MHDNKHWWRQATIYQIYPKSFCDSGAKGTGDIKGIISKLDYIQKLGVDAIWLTPIYASPQIDNGYDIADYYAISPEHGTMDDVDTLIEQAHLRGIKIIMDIVVNHTSTEHAWFQSAISDKNSPYRDYYIWHEGVDGQAPNNWQSKFGGNAWEFDPKSREYYLHLFAKEQADLNWENPKVRQEVKDIIGFWANKKIDGFRLDVINLISKQKMTKENNYLFDDIGDGRRFYTDGPRVHEYLQEISQDTFQKYGVMTVGEMSSTSIDHCQKYSDPSEKELSMVFNFHHLKVDYPNGEKWQLADFDLLALKTLFRDWQHGLYHKGWNALFWCNHDQPRIVSRFGCDTTHRVTSAKMLAAAIHFLQGTPYIYQGEEIGMTNPHFKHLSDYQDVESVNMFAQLTQSGLSEKQALTLLAAKSRDNSRTPMQWDQSPQAGFTKGKPWLAVANNFNEINVESALADEDSVFYFYQDLIKLRKSLPIITEGDYQDLLPNHPDVLCYQRQYKDEYLIVICNFRAFEVQLEVPLPSFSWEKRISHNIKDKEKIPLLSSNQTLQPYECKVFHLMR